MQYQYLPSKDKNLKHIALMLCLSALSPFLSLNAATYTVKTPVEYNQTIKNIVAGDEIILADGIWQDFEINFSGQGTKAAPITLSAQTKGKVILSGQSNLRLSGQYLHVSGLVFKNGYSPSREVIAFRSSDDDFAHHSRVSEVVIDNFNKPERFDSDQWVALYGKNNRFDHNHLVGKRNKGVTLTVRLKSPLSQQNNHQIDHNYFGPRPTLGSNGGETIRIGTSHHSMSASQTVIENNYFDRCDGEVEIISVKSGNNTIRNNTFFASRGTLTLRHGNANQISSNVFLGNGVEHTGGVRVINRDQIVTNNYFEGLTGYRFGSGFTIMNGVPNSPLNRYHQVVNANINHNSFIDVNHIHLAAGSDAERSAAPLETQFSKNLLVNRNQLSPFAIFDDISGISFTNNVSNKLNNNSITQGIDAQSIKLVRAENGLLYPSNNALSAYGISTSLTPTLKSATGVSWYPKTEPEIAFDSGNQIAVSTAQELKQAVNHASAGDVIALNNGEYQLEQVLLINKPLTIKARVKQQAKLSFSQSSLFEIQNNGSLKLDGLVISGKNSTNIAGNDIAANDVAENSVVKTTSSGMLTNYRFSLLNSEIKQLDNQPSFHFFDSGARAFADNIVISNNHFINISGDILRLNKETDDKGIYNAEYVQVNNNQFEHIQGSLVNLYRGGKDESTFGPHLTFVNNHINQVGLGKRNPFKASLYLHGVQVTDMANNQFTDSAAVKIEHTTGDPITQLSHNQFTHTLLPTISALYENPKFIHKNQ
ncbi:polysaccharide lyase 6 family protein [Shewanella sp. 6_MG-2023]|uniref:polysaccharide lyase 6 family protein n=1 Tax=Shewanella sp. 6_MG-2023 TaxID=3062660 RepID=UPI0026E2A80B|nr:polysaccharide lyase 6 family protein [Shewanella sp. 6_MG-2023]MDO6619164.1 polysaccharide lyase 6 family protein [Shewanella sp. 6_MG-2023]